MRSYGWPAFAFCAGAGAVVLAAQPLATHPPRTAERGTNRPATREEPRSPPAPSEAAPEVAPAPEHAARGHLEQPRMTASLQHRSRGRAPAPAAPEVAPVVRSPFIDEPAGGVSGALFRNTYYYFPTEPEGAQDTPLYGASCQTLALVPRIFHDDLCVQGSGRLATGATMSFARRDCACAAVCPRTGQRICFDMLDPARFPAGRGATGRAIRPLHTLAVDPAVVPLGSVVYIPELAGLPRLDGSPHDGCFVAEDRGIRVVGQHVDVFTGDARTMRQWQAAVPSQRGVHVTIGDPRCRGAGVL